MRSAQTTAFALVFGDFVGQPARGQTPAEHPRVAEALELARVWLEAQRAVR